MSDQFSIKDLPTNIDEKARYWMSGKTMLIITNLLSRLWNGDNVGTGPGIQKKGVFGSGYSLSSTASAGGSSSSHPYKGFNASAAEIPKVKIQYGTHNSIIPTIDGLPMAVDINSNVLTLGEDDTMVYVQLDLDEFYAVSSASIHSGDTLPTSDDETSYQILFAVDIVIEDEVATVTTTDNVSGSQAYNYCGGSHSYGLV